MQRVLQSLHSVEGVQGSLVLDGNGQILVYQAHALYDLPLLEQVAQSIIASVDAVQLLHEDWDMVNANYSEGSLIVKNLKPGGAAAGRNVFLSLIADKRLNFSFVSVAIRVAAGKLKAILESAPKPATAAVASAPVAMSSNPPPPSSSQVGMNNSSFINAMGGATVAGSSQVRLDVGGSGLSWSGLGASGKASEVAVADAESAAFLSKCTKALAMTVGPMAKVFVKEAVRKLCPDREFSRAQGEALAALLRGYIEDPTEANLFLKTVLS